VVEHRAYGFAPIAEAGGARAAPSAALPQGARAIFSPTPALTAIDIDGGAASGERGEKSAAQGRLNRAIIPALARQIRLRNLGGAILIDFAGMKASARPSLAPDLSAALARDPLKPRLLGFTSLGFAEVLRPRIRPPLHEILP
jgi:Rne/Rng family ribonuclease